MPQASLLPPVAVPLSMTNRRNRVAGLLFAAVALFLAASTALAQVPLIGAPAAATVGGSWTQQSPATSPPAREYHTMAYDTATGTVVLFGGFGNNNLYADTWMYNGTSWTQQSPAASPPARELATMTYDTATGTVVLFGGFSQGAYLADTWTYNGTTWTQQFPATSPPARYASTMAYDGVTGTVVLFGGYNSTGYLADTWTYNGTTWTQQTPATSPSARYYPTMAYDQATGTLVMFGGFNGSSLGDTWVYTGTTWMQRTPATSPPVRYESTTAYDAATQTVVLFGGYTSPGILADTWTYDGTTWTQQSPASGPPARHGATTAYDAATGTVVLFGGNSSSGSSVLADTWTYAPGAYVAPTANVGTAAAQTPVYFNITSTGTVGTPQVLTQGAANLDFTLGTVNTCTGAATGICQVNVAFTPQAPGVRLAAVNLYDGSGTIVIATALISGTGTGPLLTLSPGLIGTVAGNGLQGYTASQDTGTTAATATSLYYPSGVAVDGAGNLYIADYSNNRIRKVTAATGFISTVAGNGTACAAPTASPACGDGTAATAASLNLPSSVAVDGAGNLYIADYNNQRIRKVTAATGSISTVAGNGTGGYTASQDTGTTAATAASLHYPSGVAVDGAGNLYIADGANNRIRKVTAATGYISTVAGNGTAGYTASQDTGTTAATAASLQYPAGVAVDGAGNLYIADQNNNRIRKVTAATGYISTVAGNGTGGYTASQDTGTTAATAASLQYPAGVAVDGAGNLYIADEFNNRIRKVTAATGNISTLAGKATAGYTASQDTGTTAATAASLYYPIGVALDGAGNLYIADENNNRIRKVSVTGSIVFPTATSAGTSDTTDGTKTLIANNIGNSTLTFASQVETGSSFVLANPMTGGCVSNGTIAAGGSCLIGATFAPVAGSTGVVNGNVLLTDNSLNAAGTTQNIPLSGVITTGSAIVDIGSNIVTSGTASVNLPVVVGYSGAAGDLGAITVLVNGSSAGVNAPASCVAKASHKNCAYTYTGTLLNTPGNYTTSVAVAADAADGYSAASTTGYLTVNGVAGHAHPAPVEPVSKARPSAKQFIPAQSKASAGAAPVMLVAPPAISADPVDAPDDETGSAAKQDAKVKGNRPAQP